MKKFIAKITTLSMKQYIVIGSAMFAVGLGTVGIVLWQTHKPKGEQLAEVDTETFTVAEVEIETETEMEMETEVLTEVVEVPTFVTCSVSGKSIAKDLSLVIADNEGKRISGTPFVIKLIDPNDAKKLQTQIDAIADLNKQIEELNQAELDNPAEHMEEGNEEKNQSSVENIIYLSSVTGESVTEQEYLMIEKLDLMKELSDTISGINGTEYTDDDSDGMIKIKKIEPGKYVACLIPCDGYEATNYAATVTVKDEPEYVPLTTTEVEQITVSASAAGDVQSANHNAVTVENVMVDTVDKVLESKKIVTPAVYAKTKAIPLKSSVSKEMQNKVRNCEIPVATSDMGIALCDLEGETEGENSVGDTQMPSEEPLVEVIQSNISISKEAILYSCDDNDAASAVIKVSSTNVSNINVTSDNQIVSVSTSGDDYVIKVVSGVKDKKVDVNVTATGEDLLGNSLSVTSVVHVEGNGTQLKDANDNLLYMDEQGTTKATVAEYSTDLEYYFESEPELIQYQGWQKLEGSQFYFTENYEPIKGEQVIGGQKYNFGSDGALLTSGVGIDVSKWQSSINWSEASTAVSFAIVRAGFRGSSGNIAEDPRADANISGAKNAGLKVGVYFYSRATNEAEAIEEASLAIAVAKRNGGVSLPIYIDMEDSSQLSITTEERDAIVAAFCRTVTAAGYRPGVYANKYWLTNYLTPSKYSGYSIWCAQYNTSCTYSGRYDIWQYTSSGTVPGISGNVDMNQSYF